MPLPSSGTISTANVNTEIGVASTAQIDLNQTTVRKLFGVPTPNTEISMSNGYGKTATISIQANVIGGGGRGGADAGGGGAGGGHAQKTFTVNWLTYSASVTVGGVSGTSTAFGMTATGGATGGNVFQGLSSPGTASGGDFNASGGSGGGGDRGGSRAATAPGTSGAIRGGGGGGGWFGGSPSSGLAPTGNGGTASQGSGGTGGAATNYGAGGGGGASNGGAGGAGSQGVVIVKYTSATQLFTGGSVTFASGVYTHTFTSSGTLAA